MSIGAWIMLAIFLANVFVTYKISKRESLSNVSKVIRIILIWAFPVFGVLLTGGFLKHVSFGDSDSFDFDSDDSDSFDFGSDDSDD